MRTLKLSAPLLQSLWLVRQKKNICIVLTILPGQAFWMIVSKKLVEAIHT